MKRKDAWCPLFGKLPTIANHNSILVEDCATIIDKARELWGAYLKDKQSYSKRTLNAARFICSVYPFAIVNGVVEWRCNKSYYRDIRKKIANAYDPWEDLTRAVDNVVFYVKEFKPETEGINDSRIIAAFALMLAYETLKDILKPPDIFPSHTLIEAQTAIMREEEIDRTIKKRIDIAKFLLEKAEQTAKGETIEKLHPDAELGAKKREQAKKFGRRGTETATKEAEKYRAVWLQAARSIRAKHSNRNKYSTRRIASEVHKKYPQKTMQTVYKYLLKIRV